MPRRKEGGLPKGAYRLPTGGYMLTTVGSPDKRGRRIVIAAIHRDDPDAKKLAEAIIAVVSERQLKQHQLNDASADPASES